MIAQAFYWYREDARMPLQTMARHYSDAALALVRYTGELGLSDAAYRD